MTTAIAYDGAPRPITEDEAQVIAHREYVIADRRDGSCALYRGGDGGYHVAEPVRRGQDAVAYVDVRRADLRKRIMAGDCRHTIFYDGARDVFYCG